VIFIFTLYDSGRKLLSGDPAQIPDQNASEIPLDEIPSIAELLELKPVSEKELRGEFSEIPKRSDDGDINLENFKPKQNPADIKNAKELIKSAKAEQKKQNELIAAQKPKPSAKHPKLAIIIDDISTKEQIDEIKRLGFPVTPSIFPPNQASPNTQNLGKNLQNYMIHLPLEALNFANSGMKVLKPNDDKKTIENAVKELRANFPNARFVNNHTGSKFSQNERAMRDLIEVLDRYGFKYVDSVTIGNSQAKTAANHLKKPYVYRDIFLDNEASVPHVKAQLQKAVKIAKQKGIAIAIGHPKSATFSALKSSKSLLKDVEVVYIKDIYELYH